MTLLLLFLATPTVYHKTPSRVKGVLAILMCLYQMFYATICAITATPTILDSLDEHFKLEAIPKAKALVENRLGNLFNNLGFNFNAGILKEILNGFKEINSWNRGIIANALALANPVLLNHNQIKLGIALSFHFQYLFWVFTTVHFTFPS
jgi:hypothetical protein